VLAVEDEPAVLAAAVETLTDLGYGVVAAHDATEALEQLRGTGRVDVLFSDVVMPGPTSAMLSGSSASAVTMTPCDGPSWHTRRR
jgi:CheY-like chemotaxis protein